MIFSIIFGSLHIINLAGIKKSFSIILAAPIAPVVCAPLIIVIPFIIISLVSSLG